MAPTMIGSCPACGLNVPRTVASYHGVATETYHCPQDGSRSYTPHGISTEQWAAPSMSTLRMMAGNDLQIDWLTA